MSIITITTVLITFLSMTSMIESKRTERSFDGYTVLRLQPETVEQLTALHDLQVLTETDAKYRSKVDFWKSPRSLNSSVDLMIAPEVKKDIMDTLYASSIKGRIMIPNLQTLLNEEKKSDPNHDHLQMYGLRDYENFFADYHTLSEVHQYMEWLAAKREFVSIVSIGKSTEGRELKAFHINKRKRGQNNGPKPLIWIDCGIHAREWISPATCLYMSTQLIEKGGGKDADETIVDILDNFDFTILPSSNPDGYVHTHENDRMWRKTRSRSGSAWDFVCRGTDPNRNWGFHWNEAGSSSNPCSDIYAGPKPFSEPETKSMSNYILKEKDRMAMYLTIHSYSQLILTPWGWTDELPPAYPDMKRAGDSAARALKSLYGTEYTVGSSTQVLYAAAGGSDDWAHGVANIKYSYTIELRDTGDHGFVLPKEQIIPTGEETMLALIDLCHTIAQERNMYSGPVKSSQ